MKKFFTLMVSAVICLSVSFMFADSGKATEKVDAQNCTLAECHFTTIPGATDDPLEEHNRHPTGAQKEEKGGVVSCASCHENGVGELGDVFAIMCTECHLEACLSIQTHEAENGASCFQTTECHLGGVCDPNATTTTTTTTTCPTEAIYGEDSREVLLLRSFRDDVLSTNPAGRKAIKLYYKLSPMLVSAIEKNETFKNSIKKRIDELLPVIEALLITK